LEAHDWLPEALHHQSLGRILCAEAEASVESLRAQSVPVVWWHASPLTASLLGEWMTSVMLAVAVVGRAVGVSAFDQPAVDDIKRRMVVLLGSSPRR
jgi:glucose-6-phosphate isomerase